MFKNEQTIRSLTSFMIGLIMKCDTCSEHSGVVVTNADNKEMIKLIFMKLDKINTKLLGVFITIALSCILLLLNIASSYIKHIPSNVSAAERIEK